jgi:4-aminobutyrate aminotransferase-like enzyme
MTAPSELISTLAWANPPVDSVPHLVSESPGPASRVWHARMDRHTAGSVTQMVKLHPVAYASGEGVTLTDVDGNRYLDFSSGIVITNLGHAHPRVAEAIGRAASELDNVHDFATPHKVRALEALDAVTPPGMSLFTFFSSGTEAIEGAMRVARAITGRFGFVSFHNDYHGRTGGRRASPRRGRRTRCATPAATSSRAGTPTAARSAPTRATCAARRSSASRSPRTCPASSPAS